jgi:hypothetical protein
LKKRADLWFIFDNQDGRHVRSCQLNADGIPKAWYYR